MVRNIWVLKQYCKARWPQPVWTNQLIQRTQSLLNQKANEGLLRRGYHWSRNAIGIYCLRKVLYNTLHLALTKGTADWDVVVLRCMLLAFLCATNARVGDLITSQADQMPRSNTIADKYPLRRRFLVNGDLQIFCFGEATVDNVSLKLAMWGKGFK